MIKWKKREFVDDAPMGPKEARSTVLSREEEALIVAFRRHTLLPLDDCLYALQATIPHLTRSSLHRLFQRHDISRLPDVEGAKPRKKFKTYPIGYFHIDIAEVRTENGKLHMFVAIDRVSKFAYAELHARATRRIAADFLRKLIEIVPYKIHTVLTDNGTHFTEPRGKSWSVSEIKAMIEHKAIEGSTEGTYRGRKPSDHRGQLDVAKRMLLEGAGASAISKGKILLRRPSFASETIATMPIEHYRLGEFDHRLTQVFKVARELAMTLVQGLMAYAACRTGSIPTGKV